MPLPLRLLASAVIALATALAADAGEHLALLGTYTDHGSKGIYAVRLDDATGALSAPVLVASLRDPEFLALHPSGRYVYALTHSQTPDGQERAGLAAFVVDAATGALAPLNEVSFPASALTHLAVDATGRMIVAASYNGGYVVSFPLAPDGRIGPLASRLAQTGPLGPNRARQDAPHPHSVTLSPDNRFAFVADLGLDRICAYRLDSAHGTIAPATPPFTSLAPGVGPRHTKFSPDGRSFYVIDELEGSVASCRYDATGGTLTPLARTSTLPAGFSGTNSSSELRVHPSGRWVYAANRGPNSLAVFARDSATGALTLLDIVPTGGAVPRNFALSPDGAWLLCAHQASDNLTVFKVDPANGRLTATSASARVPTAVCVLFLR